MKEREELKINNKNFGSEYQIQQKKLIKRGIGVRLHKFTKYKTKIE